MNTGRLWILGAAAAMIVIALGGWFIGISPVVSQASAANAQVASVSQANQASEQKVALLKQQYAHIGPLQKSLNALRRSIPEVADASAFLQELNDLSAADGVTISSVTIASSTVYQLPAAAGATGAAATTTPASTPAPAATTPVVAPVTSSGLFVQIPVTITVTGSFDAVRNFVGSVQKGKRLYLATAVSLSQGAAVSGASGQATGTLTGYIFTLQGTSDEPKSTEPTSTPTPAPTDTPIPTGSPTPGLTPTPTPTPTPTLTPSP
jgi:Tfp pilus assembly protein PilO